MTEAIAPSEAAVLHVAARDIPVPQLVSPEAQAMLALGPMGDDSPCPPLDDLDAWRALITAGDEMVQPMLAGRAASMDADVDVRDVDGVTVYVITPRDVDPEDPRVPFEIHAHTEEKEDTAWRGGRGSASTRTGTRTTSSS